MRRAVAVAHEHRRGPRGRVVVRAHCERVRAGRRDGQEVADARRRKRDVVDEDVARLAVEARDADRLRRRLVGARRRECRVPRAVELRARVVRHASVDRDPGDGVEPLHRAHAVERDSGAADERTTRLERDPCGRQVVRLPGCGDGSGDATRQRAEIDRGLAEHVADTEPAAHVHDGRRPAELVAAAGRERCEQLDGRRVGGHVGELRADVDVHAGDVEVERQRVADDAESRVGREPELRSVVAGPDRLVRVGLDAEGHADEDAPDARRDGSPGLSFPVEDDGRACIGRRAQLLVRLRVSVHDELLAAEAGRSCERELAERGGVGSDAVLGEEPKQGHVRERLRTVEELCVGHGARGGFGRCARIVSSQYTTSGVPNRSASSTARTPPSVSAPRSMRAESGKSSSIGRILPGTVFGSCSSFLR